MRDDKERCRRHAEFERGEEGVSIYQKFEELEDLLKVDLEHCLDQKANEGNCAVVALLESVLWGVHVAKIEYEMSLQ